MKGVFCLFFLAVAQGWRAVPLVRRLLSSAFVPLLLASSLAGPQPALSYEAFAEDFGNTQSSAGSISLNPFASAEDIEASRAKVRKALQEKAMRPDGPKSDMDLLLEQIPSWKYYKIISEEYAKRGAGYDGKKENLLMPLM